MGHEARPRIGRSPGHGRARVRVTDRRNGADLGHAADRIQAALDFGRDGHEADVAASKPFAEQIQVHVADPVDGNRPGGLRIQKRPFQMKTDI